jgi:multidrug efflux system membrane fusion protein
VLFSLPETTVSDLLTAQARGRVSLEAHVGDKVVGKGRLEVIDNRIDQTTGTVKLKGLFANKAQTLWPGQFVNIRLHLKTLENVTVVPTAAVQQGMSGRFVYVIQPNKTVKLTTVMVVQEDERSAVIGSGLKPGERVATVGFANLRDGSKISLDDGKHPKGGKKRKRKGTGGSAEESGSYISGAAAAEVPASKSSSEKGR